VLIQKEPDYTPNIQTSSSLMTVGSIFTCLVLIKKTAQFKQKEEEEQKKKKKRRWKLSTHIVKLLLFDNISLSASCDDGDTRGV